MRDYEIRQGESGHGNRPEDQEVFHGQGVAHDQFERGEIAKGRQPPDTLDRRPQLLRIVQEQSREGDRGRGRARDAGAVTSSQ